MLIDRPVGFIVINTARRICMYIGIGQYVKQCRLQEAVHYLRNYRHQTVGLILSSHACDQQEIAIIHCANGPWALSDNAEFHRAKAMIDRMLKLVVRQYNHVTFWRDTLRSEQRQEKR